MTAGCVHESYVTLIHFNILCDMQTKGVHEAPSITLVVIILKCMVGLLHF